MSETFVTVVGAGLAGSEAAWQLVSSGIPVHLFEMRPEKRSKAHKTGLFAELVCSNSFRGAALANAVGVLKEELHRSGSLIMEAAHHARVPAGGALAVDREVFSEFIHSRLTEHPLVTVVQGEVTDIPEFSRTSPVILATGPLTSELLAKAIQRFTGDQNLAFFDAISPIITGDSIDLSKIFRASRYDKGDDDYLNIPLTEEQYYTFIDAVTEAEKYGGHAEVESDQIDNIRPFEGCMPIEDMVARGRDTLRFGPFKPVGLTDPNTGSTPFANVQLRQDNTEGTLWSMVGMQTRMKHPEQKRIFTTLLPGLENAEFVRLGSVHRNTFIDSPRCLNATLEVRNHPGLFFAGQVTGTEGYVESTAGGFVAGVNAARVFAAKDPLIFPDDTAMGSLMEYISNPDRKDFQPMNISFGLMKSYFNCPKKENGRRLGKRQRRERTAEKALESIVRFTDENLQISSKGVATSV
jgi:methylenetetrahydrofolate--tRNA-(uracil-5-)-methyltransferase